MENKLDLKKFKACSCGASIESEEVKAKYSYGAIGWFLLSMGTTATPRSIVFYCDKCSTTFETLYDKELIKHYAALRKK